LKKQLTIIITLGLFLCCVSCHHSLINDLETKVADLETKVAELEKKVTEQESTLERRESDVTTLSVVIHSAAVADVFGSPLDNFFAAPEFWENTYEVDPSVPCLQQCADNYSSANEQCQQIEDIEERQECVNQAFEGLRNCTRACRGSTP
jgi:hypothetical protein